MKAFAIEYYDPATASYFTITMTANDEYVARVMFNKEFYYYTIIRVWEI